MNCPNCGGTLNLNKLYCEFCDTTFTAKELGLAEEKVHKENINAVKEETAPQREKTLTEKRAEELEKERKNRKVETSDNDELEEALGRMIRTAPRVRGRIRGFFRDVKRTVCMVLLIVVEIAFAVLMISGILGKISDNEILTFALSNVVILANALLMGLICRVGRIRICTVLSGIVSTLSALWVFVVPLLVNGFEGVTPQYVMILAVCEMAVIGLCVLFAHLIYKR